MEQLIFEVTIPARQVVKKNTQRVIGYGKSRRAIYSPQFLAWERIAIKYINEAKPPNYVTYNCHIHARFEFYFKNHQWESDCSNLIEGPQDVLTKCGIISDDKIIYSLFAEKLFGSCEQTVIKLYSRYGIAK